MRLYPFNEFIRLTIIERCELEIRDILHQLFVTGSLLVLTVSLGGIKLVTRGEIAILSNDIINYLQRIRLGNP